MSGDSVFSSIRTDMAALPFEGWGLSIRATDGFEGMTHTDTLPGYLTDETD